jgi:formylglycine-generating enzyme required for sulfatase activity
MSGEPDRKFLVEPATGIEFVLIPGGEFTMGSNGGRHNEKPPHQVTVSSFYLARHEVTQRAWERVTGTRPSRFADCGDCPVEQVSWDDVQDFLRRAGARAGVTFRLPTEAEWEYAAGGGGSHQAWPGTNSSSETGDFAWYSGNFSGKTRSVGLKLPNLYGLYDMAGNVGEWCADRYSDTYYQGSPADNPRGPDTGDRRVVRGGSWLSDPNDIRVTHRSRRSADSRSPAIGFRVALDPSVTPRGASPPPAGENP